MIPVAGAGLDTEALQRILISGKLNSNKIEILAEGLKEPRESYLFCKRLRKARPANEIAKMCINISKISQRLLKKLTDTDGCFEICLLLEKFEVDTGQMVEMLTSLHFAANEAGEFMRKGVRDTIVSALDAHFEKPDEEELEECDQEIEIQPDEREIKNRIATAVLLSSLVASKEKNRETAETKLFLDLRQLFIDLGGTAALNSKILYQFVKTCATTIDEAISLPSHPSFRRLLEKAIRRAPRELIK
jgi:hypothetical protein